jgi:Raf kinase inhibitor-like YbhB/YbcL family protein
MKTIIKYKWLIILLCIIIISLIYINLKGDNKMNNDNNPKNNIENDVKEELQFEVTSPAFKNGDYIPAKYTGHGEDISIPLLFNNVSSSGKSIAVIMDDPDAPTTTPFVHWLIWNIPASITKIPEGIPNTKDVSILNGAVQGKNGFGRIGYMGPNPPSGTHTYKIKICVLDTFLNLGSESSKEDIEKAMNGHIIESYLLEGKFSR